MHAQSKRYANWGVKLPLCVSMVASPFMGMAKNADAPQQEKKQPNILVFVTEDISPYLGCYGDKVVQTPNLDKFATQGIKHSNMFTCVGVSSPSRYSLITGRYSAVDGANYMRVNHFLRSYETTPPAGVKCYTEFMRKAGYYCTNNEKTDYQFAPPVAAWDEQGLQAHWKHAPKDKPFFAIFNTLTTHESMVWVNNDKPLTVKEEDIVVPPYYPDTKTVRHDMAVLYTNINKMDTEFGNILAELEASDRADNTIVIFYSDNGGPLPRAKREILDSGTRVPFMIRFPNGMGAGTVEDALQMFVDIPATILSLAGLETPEYMHGQAFYGDYKVKKERKYVFGATDRFDEQIEKRGSIRDDRYLYVRNYMPDQSLYRPVAYRLSMPMMKEMVDMYNAGKLNEAQSIWFNPKAAEEELYDCEKDPHNVHNLVGDKKYAKRLKKMRKAYDEEWIQPFVYDWMMHNEQYFIERAWPNAEKQVCPQPTICEEGGKMTIEADQSIYSVSYLKAGSKQWQLYMNPVEIPANERPVQVRVERIGFVPAVAQYK